MRDPAARTYEATTIPGVVMGVGTVGVMVVVTDCQKVISKGRVVLLEAKQWAEIWIELLVTLVRIWVKEFKSTEEGKELKELGDPKYLPRTGIITRRARLWRSSAFVA